MEVWIMIEYWDIYDECFLKTGKTHKRGTPLAKGEYHLVVNIYPINSKGELLIQKRSETISWKPGFWAATGGSAVAGEDAFTTCQRELWEELGIEATRENTSLVLVHKKADKYIFLYLVKVDIELHQLLLQEAEVADVRWVTITELKAMVEDGRFHKYHYLDELYDFIDNY